MARDTITGTGGADTLRETSLSNELNKGDTLVGLAGDDTYFWQASTWFQPGTRVVSGGTVIDIPGRDVPYRTTIVERPGEGFDIANLDIRFASLLVTASEMANVERIVLNNPLGPTQRIELVLDGNATEVIGAGARDTVTGNGGNDFFDGGGGEDTAVFTGPRAGYAIVNMDGTTFVSGGTDGTDRLRNVEFLKFPDATLPMPAARSPLEYIASHPDLRAAFGTDAAAGLQHFMNSGLAEHRAITFDAFGYIASYPDLVAAFGADAAAGARHYIRSGAAEGRQASFDATAYVAANAAELMATIGRDSHRAAEHYLTQGLARGLPTSFDGLRYIASYPDLVRAFGADARAGLEHFMDAGFREGRRPSFDAYAYIASYPDLQAAFGTDAAAALRHYLVSGFNEGRTVSFDGFQYLAANNDLIGAFGTDTARASQHYVTFGRAEGRTTSFDGGAYVLLYPDLDAAAPADYANWGTQHYVRSGFGEGRLHRDSAVFPGAQALVGDAGINRLFGGLGDDSLEGRGSIDILVGGRGADRFVYTVAGDSYVVDRLGRATADVIADFRRVEGDRIDLSAVATGSGSPTFTFVANYASFTGPGQVTSEGGFVYANTDSDPRTFELAVLVLGTEPIVASDLIL